jgi:3-oxoacyl-[acyl-carrier protein] reductase/meso-butanediol dehydrogenase/(S,S)-butanediol dehydrogenase/diacetyl reductase
VVKKHSKTVIITGGTKGIGASISMAFHKKGYHVLISARNDNGLADQLGEGARFMACDVRNLEDHRALVKAALEWTNRVDVYINCAGISIWRSLDNIDEEFWNKIIDVNLKGVFWGCKAAAEKMRQGGAIINISSLAGKRGSSNNSVYCASKFGVNGLTQALAKELGPRNIRVNAVCPVYVKTNMLLKELGNMESPAQGEEVSVYLDNFANTQSALKRLPIPGEIASVCLFLASDEASAITGQCINVDCGVLPQ